MIAGIEQALLLELASISTRNAAGWQRHADRLVVDESAAAAHRSAICRRRISGDASSMPVRAAAQRARMIRRLAPNSAVTPAWVCAPGRTSPLSSPPAESQAERIQEDGFAERRFARQRQSSPALRSSRAGR
jgi:hypothetical protein